MVFSTAGLARHAFGKCFAGFFWGVVVGQTKFGFGSRGEGATRTMAHPSSLLFSVSLSLSLSLSLPTFLSRPNSPHSNPYSHFTRPVRQSYKDCDKIATIHNGFDKIIRKCKKKAISRASKELQCPPGWEKKAALCYKPCKDGEKDAGLTCYTPKYEKWSLAKLANKFNDFVDSIKKIPGVNEILKFVEGIVNTIMAPVMKALNFPKLAGFPALPSPGDFPLDNVIDKMEMVALIDIDIDLPNKIESALTSVLSAAEKLVPTNLLEAPNLSGLISKITPSGLDILDLPMRAQAALDDAAAGLAAALPKEGLSCEGWKDHTVPITEPIAKALGRFDDSDWCPASLSFTMCTGIDFSPLSKALKPVLQAMFVSSSSSSSSSSSFLEEEMATQASRRGLRSSRGDKQSIEEEFWAKIAGSTNQWGVNFGAGIVDELLSHLVPKVKIGLRPGGLERATLGRTGAFFVAMGLDKNAATKKQTDGATEEGNFASGFVEFAPTLTFGMDVGADKETKKPYIDFKVNIAVDMTVEAGLTNPSAVKLAYHKAADAFSEVDRVLTKMAHSEELKKTWRENNKDPLDQYEICPWTDLKEYRDSMKAALLVSSGKLFTLGGFGANS